MSITISSTLKQAQYENLRYALIAQFEGKSPTPYFDKANPPLITIGIGFNIDRENKDRRNEVMDAMGFSPAQKQIKGSALDIGQKVSPVKY
ncbi:hypothetical protein [Syntrophotalea carbinolica]|uniref:hypothetical protein n=1 Tax=Syntrophotalea carbinolica TaxID=19 RepID=UPI0005A0AD71|nr:hypothetical protein [Syntrophotalea carbinolica]